MQIVMNGSLTEAEQDICVKYITRKVPIGLIEKLYLDVDDDGVSISYTLKRIRELRKMSGAVIGSPEVVLNTTSSANVPAT